MEVATGNVYPNDCNSMQVLQSSRLITGDVPDHRKAVSHLQKFRDGVAHVLTTPQRKLGLTLCYFSIYSDGPTKSYFYGMK